MLERMFDHRGPDPLPCLTEMRVFRPQRPVWGHLDRVFPFGEPRGGLDLQGSVPGLLKQWHRTTTGHRVGWVDFKLSGAFGGLSLHQYVVGYALEPRQEEKPR